MSDQNIKDCVKLLWERINELKQQNKELKELLKQIDENVLTEWPYEYLYYRNRVSEIINK